jgi:hypothetical protein
MAILIDANFPGGGLESARIVEDHIYYTAPVDGSLTNRTCWFYFRLRGAKGRRLTFVQEEMVRTLEVNIYGTYEVVQPVVREEEMGEWVRIPKENIFYDSKSLYFSFCYKPTSDETYIAFCYPYQYADLLSFVQMHSNNPLLRVETLHKSMEGRDYPILLIGDFDSPTQRDLVFLSSRQHAGETPGSFVLEGLLSRLLSNDDVARALLEKCVFLVVPMVNIDGVEEGRYGKDAPPIDYNRDWRYDAQRAEIRAILSFLDILNKRYRIALRFDFHSPHPGGPTHLVPGRFSVMGEKAWRRSSRMRLYVQQLFEPVCACRVDDLEDIYFCWAQENYRHNQNAYLEANYGTEGFTLEVAYHCDRNGRSLDPAIWRKMGGTLAKAIWDNYYNPTFSFDDDLDNLEICFPDWTVVCLPENVQLQPEGRTMVIKAEKQYNRTVRQYDGFVTDKHVMRDGAYLLRCQGSARLKVFAYYLRDMHSAARSDAFDLMLKDETLEVPFSWLQSDSGYAQLYASFRITFIEGVLTIVYCGDKKEPKPWQ